MKANTIRVETYAAYETLAVVENAALNAGKVALFIGAPIIGLAFVIAAPFFGLGVLAWLAAKALFGHRFVRNAALFVAAPFIGLAYAFTLPFVGIVALAWVALGARHA